MKDRNKGINEVIETLPYSAPSPSHFADMETVHSIRAAFSPPAAAALAPLRCREPRSKPGPLNPETKSQASVRKQTCALSASKRLGPRRAETGSTNTDCGGRHPAAPHGPVRTGVEAALGDRGLLEEPGTLR